MPEKLQSTIFGHVEELLSVNSILLARLEKSTVGIGRVFMDVAPFFKIYSTYVRDFNETLTKLQV